MKAFVGGLIVIFGFIATLILISLWNAWAIAILWAWFIAPVFNAPIIGYWQAAGIALFASTIKPNTISKDAKNTNALGTMVFGPPVAVAFGWLIKVLGGM